MRLLSIDTSCDETSVAVTDGPKVLSNVISSQVMQHGKFGGVVPMLAQRLHRERINRVVELALQRAHCLPESIGAVAVTYGPGLAPALQVGIDTAKLWSGSHSVPLYLVDHMLGHLYSPFAQVGSRLPPELLAPLLAILVSGGHTELIRMEHVGTYTVVGETVDDALGEAYDKVAVMLGLGYPGGQALATLASRGRPDRYNLPVPMVQSGNLNLSYSGLKTAVKVLVRGLHERHGDALPQSVIENVAASFEYVAQKALLFKVERALTEYPDTRMVILAGGVAANTVLRAQVRLLATQRKIAVAMPANKRLTADNAAMIGVAAWYHIGRGQQPADLSALDRRPGLRVDQSGLFD